MDIPVSDLPVNADADAKMTFPADMEAGARAMYERLCLGDGLEEPLPWDDLSAEYRSHYRQAGVAFLRALLPVSDAAVDVMTDTRWAYTRRTRYEVPEWGVLAEEQVQAFITYLTSEKTG